MLGGDARRSPRCGVLHRRPTAKDGTQPTAPTTAPTTRLPEGIDDEGLRAALAEAGEAGGGAARGSSTLLEVSLVSRAAPLTTPLYLLC